MKNLFPSLFMLPIFLTCSALQAETDTIPPPQETRSTPLVPSNFEAFTGKITKNKVRMRLQPTYDGSVIQELKRNDLVIILGETEDFYAVQPPPDTRAYVFRTYILDNMIEGNRVNVRLKPDLESPVVAQLNSGDRVEGSIDPSNNKWFEIKLPPSARFYIAKDYVEKAGDVGLLARLQKKQEEVYRLLKATESVSQAEMQKPFDQIHIDGIKANYQRIISDYPEFPEAGAQAKELLALLQEGYTVKRLAYLEAQAQNSSSTLEANKKLAEELQAHKLKLANLEKQAEKSRQFNTAAAATAADKKSSQLPVNMSTWIPTEESLFSTWAQEQGNNPSPADFYENQKEEAFILKGVIDPYTRLVKNKPGDYMLINSVSKLPIAYLYSTHVNLQDYVGHEVSLLVTPRPNNSYAFPAYFVLSLE